MENYNLVLTKERRTRMKLTKRLAVVGCLFIMLFATLTANDTNVTNGSIFSFSSIIAQASTSTTVYGKVTKISGKKITLALGSVKMHDNTSSKTKPSGAPNVRPSGVPKVRPSGAPNKAPGDNFFTKNGKTLTITLTSKSVIKIKSKTGTAKGSLSKIKVNSILSISYTKKGAISTITILNPSK